PRRRAAADAPGRDRGGTPTAAAPRPPHGAPGPVSKQGRGPARSREGALLAGSEAGAQPDTVRRPLHLEVPRQVVGTVGVALDVPVTRERDAHLFAGRHVGPLPVERRLEPDPPRPGARDELHIQAPLAQAGPVLRAGEVA